MDTYTVSIEGTTPFMMHAPTTIDPLNQITRDLSAVTSKRSKTIDDHARVARLEWEAGMYFDDESGPYIPSEMLEACIRDGGKHRKLGKEITRSVFVTDSLIPIGYEGPRDIDGLWDNGFSDRRPVKVQTSKVIRTRPLFREWWAEATIAIDEERIDLDEFRACVVDAGRLNGIGDFRPRFGRFDLIEIKPAEE